MHGLFLVICALIAVLEFRGILESILYFEE